jgi:putative SOS response-associated peptidase YedK
MRFAAILPVKAVAPTYNAAPSQAHLVICSDTPQMISRAAWGFVLEWASRAQQCPAAHQFPGGDRGANALLLRCVQKQMLIDAS